MSERMRASCAVAIAVAIACAPRASFAEHVTGIVVVGDAELKASVANHIQRWLAHRGFKTADTPLTAEALDATATCLIALDPRCARAVIEAHATTDNVVYVRVDLAAHSKDVTFNAYWFVRGHEAVAETRVCEHCQDDGWGAIADKMLDALASGSSQMGKLDLRSRPSNLTVLVDNQEVGVTPLELELPRGAHDVTLTTGGTTVAERSVQIVGGDTLHVTLKVKQPGSSAAPGDHPSRVVPLVLLGAGIAAIATGIPLIYIGEQNGPNQKYIYPDSTPVGIGLTTVGAGVLVGSVVLLIRGGGQSSSPTAGGGIPLAGVSAHGGYLGWQTRF